MSLIASISLFSAMILLALFPGPGVLVVVSRTLSLGLKQGLVTVLGILLGDFVFILLSIYGLSALAGLMGDFFIIIKYLGATYLIFTGIQILASQENKAGIPKKVSHSGSLLSGLITTLANPKAILFYASFLPAFIDLQSLTVADIGLIFIIATIAIGGVTAGYAYAAAKTKLSLKKTKHLKYGSGGLFIGAGSMLALKN